MNDKFDLLLYTLMHQGNLKLSRKKKNGELQTLVYLDGTKKKARREKQKLLKQSIIASGSVVNEKDEALEMLDKFKSLALKYDLGDNKQYRTSATGVVEKSKKWIKQL